MTHLDTGIIKKQTIIELVTIYEEAINTMKAGYALLNKSQDLFQDNFGTETYARFSVVPGYDIPNRVCVDIELKLRRAVWKVMIDMLDIRKILSVKRAEELDKQLYEWKDMPEITVQNVYDTMTSMVSQSRDFLNESIQEVYKYLRPAAYQNHIRYATNLKNARWDLGKKVIISHAVDKGWGVGKFRVNPYFEKIIVAIDKVFHALDSKGVPDGYLSPLVDAINTNTTGTGETNYFKFKCYQNQNMHLEFKRMDLVAQLNQIAGGATLRDET